MTKHNRKLISKIKSGKRYKEALKKRAQRLRNIAKAKQRPRVT